MTRFLVGAAVLALFGSANAAIFTAKHPAILADEVGKETGRSGVCAATTSVLVCVFDYPWTALRVDRQGGAPAAEGSWEPVLEPDLGPAGNGVPDPTWFRICIEGSCEIWPRSAFTFKTNP